MLLSPEIQRAIISWLREHGATYADLCAKISDDPHDRPSPSTISRWAHGKVHWIQPMLGARLIEVLGIEAPVEDSGASRLGLSNFSLEIAQTIEHMPPKYRTRVRKCVQAELMRYMSESNREHALA
jgi:hypothetical protein